MDGRTALWCLVIFFGASIAFHGLQTLTDGSSEAVSIAVQVGALGVMIGLIVAFVRRRR